MKLTYCLRPHAHGHGNYFDFLPVGWTVSAYWASYQQRLHYLVERVTSTEWGPQWSQSDWVQLDLQESMMLLAHNPLVREVLR